MSSLIQTIKNLCKKMLNLKLNLDTCATLRAIGNGIRPFPYFLRIGLSPMGRQKTWALFRHKKVQPYSQVCFHFFVPKKHPSFPSRFFIPIALSVAQVSGLKDWKAGQGQSRKQLF